MEGRVARGAFREASVAARIARSKWELALMRRLRLTDDEDDERELLEVGFC